MSSALELPLAFDGHTARVIATPCDEGGWTVRTEVDDRTLGYEHYVNWPQVERFHARMQQWVNTARNAERQHDSGTLTPVATDRSPAC